MPSLSKKAGRPDLAGALGHEAADKRIEILRHIAEGGSISEAARRCGVSYKAAWQAIETLGNLAGTPMVDKLVGGSGGGGTVITAAGLHVLEAARQLDEARAGVLAALAANAPARPAAGRAGTAAAAAQGQEGLAAMALSTSMRNQFPCTVALLKNSGGLVRVGLQLPGAGLLQARVTRESAQLLQLAAGLPVLALCKATAVQVAPQLAAAPSRNLLAGTVARASRSPQGGEATLRLPGGISLVGFAEAGTALKVGQPACAAIDEAAVVIALPG